MFFTEGERCRGGGGGEGEEREKEGRGREEGRNTHTHVTQATPSTAVHIYQDLDGASCDLGGNVKSLEKGRLLGAKSSISRLHIDIDWS